MNYGDAKPKAAGSGGDNLGRSFRDFKPDAGGKDKNIQFLMQAAQRRG